MTDVRHRSDLSELWPHVAEWGHGGGNPRDQIGTQADHHHDTERDHEDVKRQEDENRPHDAIRHHECRKFYGTNRTWMSRTAEFGQSVAADEQVPHHFRAVGC